MILFQLRHYYYTIRSIKDRQKIIIYYFIAQFHTSIVNKDSKGGITELLRPGFSKTQFLV